MYDTGSGPQTTNKRGLYRHVYGKDCHFNNSRGDPVIPRTPEEGLSLQELPRKDSLSTNSRGRDYDSKNSRGGTVTPRTPEKGL